MKQHRKRWLSRYHAAQSGQAIILVLILLVIGSLVLVPALSLSMAALRSNQKYQAQTNEVYTADSGIEDGVWRIKYDYFGPNYDPYDFTSDYSYQTDPLNGLNADVSIGNVWVPTVTLDSLGLSSADAQSIIDGERLVVSGTAGAIPGEPYDIKIDYSPADPSENLTVTSIGIWLPQGFQYAGESTLENLSIGDPARAIPTEATVPGGTAVSWNYTYPYPLFTDFPGVSTMDSPMHLDLSFNYDPPADNPDQMPTAIAWITTQLQDGSPSPYPISWDTDTRIFKITSTVGNTTIEAYSSKSELRRMGNAMTGEYVAIGNSLMLDNIYPYDRRDTLLSESTTTISSVPADGDALDAYLYWTGWQSDAHIISILTDSGSGITTNWNRATPSDWSQGSGEYVDKNMGGSAAARDLTLNSQDLSSYVPGSVLVTWDQSTQTNVFSDSFSNLNNWTTSGGGSNWSISSNRLRGRYNTGGANAIVTLTSGRDLTASGDGTINLTWQMWTSSGDGAGDGLDFAVSSDNGSSWSSNIQAFRGTISTSSGSPTNYSYSINSSYWTSGFKLRLQLVGFTGSTSLYVDNLAVTPVYDSSDGLDFAVSGDNGATWSDSVEAFRDDVTSSDSSYEYYVPAEYTTGQFQFRFRTVGLDGPGQQATIDNFVVRDLPPDTEATFKINGEQVSYDASGDPQTGTDPLVADSAAVLLGPPGSGLGGYFYRCKTDVSKLVKTYPVNPGEAHHTGNADYTVGDVDATANNDDYLAHAGWSMILVYASPTTAGHYLYLRDYFADNPGNTNLDFDGDGVPGGDVTNFVIPEPIRDANGNITETDAARITCFVGEGDAAYTGDSLKITGQQSGSSLYLSNSASPWNNVWNGASPDMSYPGIDVDTFEVPWSSGILTPGDTMLHLDMDSGSDAWTFIYLILSVRSETLTSGTTHYLINRN
jgi:hypothetical protein